MNPAEVEAAVAEILAEADGNAAIASNLLLERLGVEVWPEGLAELDQAGLVQYVLEDLEGKEAGTWL